MQIITIIPWLGLQVFAEGTAAGGTAQGTGVTGAAAEPQTGDTAPAAGVQDRNAEFERIREQYKDEFNRWASSTIQNRLRESKEIQAKHEAFDPVRQMLAQKYGLKDANDAQAVMKALEEDNSFWEDEAMEKGVSVDQLKYIKKMERENAAFREEREKQKQKENADRIYAQWMQQEADTKQYYPKFSMQAEMQNPKFLQLLNSGIDVKTAFEVLHKDEIMPAAMQYTAKTVASKVANSVAANGARPSENGNSSQSAAQTGIDVSKLSKAQRADYIRRARLGERIIF